MKSYSKPLFGVKSQFIFLISILTLAGSTLLAHPGHDLMDQGPIHVVTSPYHLASLAIFGLIICWAARLVKQRWPQRALQIAGATAVFAAGVLWIAGL
jgi:hypothetical protein